MICGALQTLNEEAFEDCVADRASPTGGPSGEPIAHENMMQSQQITFQSQQSKSQQMQQQQQQPLTPIQETVELERSLSHGSGRRLSHTINFVAACNNNNNNNINNNKNKINDYSGLSLQDHHQPCVPSTQSLSQAQTYPINDLNIPVLLTPSNEQVINRNNNETPTSTVILMSNLCDEKPFINDTRL